MSRIHTLYRTARFLNLRFFYKIILYKIYYIKLYIFFIKFLFVLTQNKCLYYSAHVKKHWYKYFNWVYSKYSHKDMTFTKISPIFMFSGRHLEFLKMLKGENFTPIWISLYTPLRVIISREKKFIREFWVRPKMCFSLPDY